jgi:hypothetical protein
MDEARLLEKLRAIEALFVGATTDGERAAAGEARKRIQLRLKALAETDPPVEYKFSVGDGWSAKFFMALCRAAWLGRIFPHRECCREIQPARRVRLAPTACSAREARGLEAARRPGRAVDSRVLRPQCRSPSLAGNRPLSGGCVMLRHERPPVSRVREIRTHGLN